MAETTETASKDGGGEIGIIDILAVMLRQRKWIVLVLVATVLIATAGFFIYPSYRAAQIAKDSKAEAVVTIGIDPLALDVMPDAMDRALVALKDPRLLYQALKTAGFESYLGLSLNSDSAEAELLLALRANASILSVTKDGPSITVIFRDKDAQRALALVSAIEPLVSASLERSLFPAIQNQVESFERFLSTKLPSQVTVTDLVKGFDAYTSAKKLLSRSVPAVTMLGSPYVAVKTTSKAEIIRAYTKLAILGSVGMMFLALLGAFVLDALGRISRDPEAMAKLRDALGDHRR